MRAGRFGVALCILLMGLGLGQAVPHPAASEPSAGILGSLADGKDLKALAAALAAAGPLDALAGSRPFTLFAPNDAAFGKLPAGTAEALLAPETRDQLTALLAYHIVPGVLTLRDLARIARDGGGKADLVTPGGQPLTVRLKAGQLALVDARGNNVPLAGIERGTSGGIVHVIGAVLLP